MQDTSQTAEKGADKHQYARRSPDEGNILWQLYSQLGSTRQAELQTILQEKSIHPSTFNSHTAATFNILQLRASTFKLYRNFFLESGVDLNDYTTAEPAHGTQKFDHNA